MKSKYLQIKGTREQALAEAARRGIEVFVTSSSYDEDTGAHETTLRIKHGFEELAQRWAETHYNGTFPTLSVVGGF